LNLALVMSTPPIRRTVTIRNTQGLHVRPAERFAKTAMQFASQIDVICESQRADAKSIMHLLTLGAKQGTELVLEAMGDDAQQAVDALSELVENGFAIDYSQDQGPSASQP
jgi:phosphotransferase system HPr (HPr) family protein